MNKPDKKYINNTFTVQSICGFCAHQGDFLKVQEYFFLHNERKILITGIFI